MFFFLSKPRIFASEINHCQQRVFIYLSKTENQIFQLQEVEEAKISKIDGSWTLATLHVPLHENHVPGSTCCISGLYYFTRWGVLIMEIGFILRKAPSFFGGFSDVVNLPVAPRCFAFVDAVRPRWAAFGKELEHKPPKKAGKLVALFNQGPFIDLHFISRGPHNYGTHTKSLMCIIANR